MLIYASPIGEGSTSDKKVAARGIADRQKQDDPEHNYRNSVVIIVPMESKPTLILFTQRFRQRESGDKC